MSNAGRGKPNMTPGSNGLSSDQVPPDLVWDENDPPVIYPCSQHTEHLSECPGDEEGIVVDSELSVRLLNEGRAWARAGMAFNGIPLAYQQKIPIAGIAVELVDLMMRLSAMRDIVCELAGVSEFEFEEKFREYKLGFLQEIREANEVRIRKQRVVDALGIKQPILGPDGNPL